MSIRNIQFSTDMPNAIEPGMFLQWEDDSFTLMGSDVPDNALEIFKEYGKAWGYLVQPHELEWLADMATRSGKGRPEE